MCFEWNSLVPLKINIFVWHLLNGGIALRPNLIRRGVQIPTELCVMCNGDVETEDHCFFKCDYVQGAWRKLWAWWNNSSIRIDSLDSFKSNILSVDNRKSSWAGFKAVSMVMLWLIWKKRGSSLPMWWM